MGKQKGIRKKVKTLHIVELQVVPIPKRFDHRKSSENIRLFLNSRFVSNKTTK
jgi:hypothetical protein